MRHECKILRMHFRDQVSGVKRFEVRVDDRNPPYAVGDELVLREWEPHKGYTDSYAVVDVLHVLRASSAPDLLHPNTCIMSTKLKGAE